MARISKREAAQLLKAFNILRRETDGSSIIPRTRYDYAEQVGTGLGSSTIVAPALWIARQFPEAPIVVKNRDGTLNLEHPIAELFIVPNPWYGGGSFKMALAFDYTISGNAYIEIERGTGGRPTALYYHPSFRITPKGNSSELVTHYEQATSNGTRIIPVEDMIHVRNMIDPQDNKRGYSALQSLVREIFTDDEAANMTASILRNYGVPGIVIKPSGEDEIPEEQANTIKTFFNRILRGDNRGQTIVSSGNIAIEKFEVDFAKMNIDRLRQIPEERVCAVIGIPAAVVGFGTGMEQTKVGATMKELRELAYENVIVPMQRTFTEEFNRVLLPEFEPRPQGMSVVFDNSEVRVLQEDEDRKSVRMTREWQAGLRTRASALRELGEEPANSDEVYRLSFADLLVPAGQMPQQPQKQIHQHVQTKVSSEGRSYYQRLQRDIENLATPWAGEIAKQLRSYADEIATAYRDAAPKQRFAQTKASEPNESDRRLVDTILLGIAIPSLAFESQYVKVAEQTAATINVSYELGIGISDPIARNIAAQGGIRKGLVDLTEDTRQQLYRLLAQARDEGLSVADTAALIGEKAGAGPWATPETRAQVIARAETKYAQNFSSVELYQQNPKIKRVEIIDAQNGTVHADRCLELNGQIMLKEQAANIEPTEHPNCLVGESMVIAPNLTGAFARWFEGEVIVLRTASNDFLTCTPNHPILTDAGWIAAKDLGKGDYVLSGIDTQGIMRRLDPYNDKMPTSIKDVFSAFEMPSGVSPIIVPGASEDFHGDGIKGNVTVIRANSLLKDTSAEHFQEFGLERAVGETALLDSSSMATFGLKADMRTAHSSVSGGGNSLSFGRASIGHVESLSLGERAHSESAFAKTSAERGLSNSYRFSNRQGGFSCSVARIQSSPITNRSLGPGIESKLLPTPMNGSRTDAGVSRYLGEGFAGLVAPVKITEVNRNDFVGHVYNLQTNQGWYIANGIITHNCSRTFIPVVG